VAKHYMVTFDIVGSRGREGDYKRVESSLKMRFGDENYSKIVKQCCIIRTNESAMMIRDSVKQILGSDSNILVNKMAYGYAVSLKDPKTRAKARTILDRIR